MNPNLSTLKPRALWWAQQPRCEALLKFLTAIKRKQGFSADPLCGRAWRSPDVGRIQTLKDATDDAPSDSMCFRQPEAPGQWLQCQVNGSNVCRVLRSLGSKRPPWVLRGSASPYLCFTPVPPPEGARNVQWFQCGRVSKARRLLYH